MQRKVCETLGNCTLSVGVDLGEEFEIHPTDKQPVGQRAAYATLNALYSGDKPNSPVLKKASLQDQQGGTGIHQWPKAKEPGRWKRL